MWEKKVYVRGKYRCGRRNSCEASTDVEEGIGVSRYRCGERDRCGAGTEI